MWEVSKEQESHYGIWICSHLCWHQTAHSLPWQHGQNSLSHWHTLDIILYQHEAHVLPMLALHPRAIQPAHPIDGQVHSCTTDVTAMTTTLSVSGNTSAQRTQDNLQPPAVFPHQWKLKSQSPHIPATQFLVVKKENRKLERWLTS